MNPDTHLLYEYMDKLPFTVRMKIRLDAPVDATLLNEAAQEAIVRFPYFSVRVGVDESQSYTLSHNSAPLAMLPERNKRLVLGSDEVNGHLVAITYRSDCIWFNFSHALCGAYGALFWIKATLYLYLCKTCGPLDSPEDIRLPGTDIPAEELAYPDESALPHDEPSSRYEGDSNVAIVRSRISPSWVASGSSRSTRCIGASTSNPRSRKRSASRCPTAPLGAIPATPGP
ncbi:MAG: hypothetical protein IKF78_02340 [Atopobiaceae bacterium]|nr:hypothetical protein [Atopobiaceae bacterium]